MRVTWRKGLSCANRWERQALLEAETQAERVRSEEIVGALCNASRSGLANCAALVVSCRCCRWARNHSALFAIIECISAHPGTTHEYKWRLRRMPGTRPVTRTAAK